MSCFRCGDPLDDFNRLDREESAWLESRPKCDICGNPIQDDHFYLINGDNVCPGCLEDQFRKEIEIYD